MGRRKSDSDGRDSNLRGTARRARTLAHFTRAAGLARRHLPTTSAAHTPPSVRCRAKRPSFAPPGGRSASLGKRWKGEATIPFAGALVAMHWPYEPGCVRGCVSTRPGAHGDDQGRSESTRGEHGDHSKMVGTLEGWLRERTNCVQAGRAQTQARRGDAVRLDNIRRPPAVRTRRQAGRAHLRRLAMCCDAQIKDVKRLE